MRKLLPVVFSSLALISYGALAADDAASTKPQGGIQSSRDKADSSVPQSTSSASASKSDSTASTGSSSAGSDKPAKRESKRNKRAKRNVEGTESGSVSK